MNISSRDRAMGVFSKMGSIGPRYVTSSNTNEKKADENMFAVVIADLISVTKDVTSEINGRLEASKNLLTYCNDLKALVMQVNDLLEELPEITSVETGIKATNALLMEILAFIKVEGDFAQEAGCCSLFRHAKDYAEDIGKYEERLRKQLDLLAKLVTIKSVQDSVSGLIENKDARSFWVTNFGDKDRSVPWRLMVDSFHSCFGATEEDLSELRHSLLDTTQDLDVSASDKMVSVFKFNTTFKTGSVEGVVKSFVSDHKDEKRIWHIVARDPTTKEEMDVDAGFVLIPHAASLSTVRSTLVSELAEDDELPEELEFLAKGTGQFHFFLEDKSRVKKNQENKISRIKQVDTATIIPDKDGVKTILEKLEQGLTIKGFNPPQDKDGKLAVPSKGDEVVVGGVGASSYKSFKIVPNTTFTY